MYSKGKTLSEISIEQARKLLGIDESERLKSMLSYNMIRENYSDQIKRNLDVSNSERLKSIFDNAMRANQFANTDLIKAIQPTRGFTSLVGAIVGEVNLGSAYQLMKSLRSYQLAQVGEAIRAVETMRSMRSVSSPLFDYFVENSEVAEEVAYLIGDAKIDFNDADKVRVASASELEQEVKIVTELKMGKRNLSLAQRGVVVSVILCLISYFFQALELREEICLFQPKIFPGLSNLQSVKQARAFLCEEADNPDFTKYRLVKGQGVRLRNGPGTKQPEIAVVLEDRALLQVIDSEKSKDWLLVKVVGEEVEGWISRRYTNRLK